MDWINQIGGLLNRYTGAQPQQVPESVHQDFDQVSQTAPRNSVAEGLAAAFRSDQTPSFGEMVAHLFAQSDNSQKAGLLGALMSNVGSGFFSQQGGQINAPALGGGGQNLSSGQADQISPDTVRKMAESAQAQDPSIVDRISQLYAEHPGLIKTLGGAALTIAMAKIAESQRGRGATG